MALLARIATAVVVLGRWGLRFGGVGGSVFRPATAATINVMLSVGGKVVVVTVVDVDLKLKNRTYKQTAHLDPLSSRSGLNCRT